MKKIALLLLFCFLAQPLVMAKDFAKMQEKEMKKAQRYNTTSKYYADYSKPETSQVNTSLKDPKLLKLSGYDSIPKDKFIAKMNSDKQKYAKIQASMLKGKTDDYNAQAYSSDFYKVYRIAERIIRANNLDYINWRIAIENDFSFNAFSTETNYVSINTGAFDTLSGNDDALALLIGHEIGHALLGHSVRKQQYRRKMQIAINAQAALTYAIAYRQFLAESKKMEYAADTEGAKLVAKAGYDLSKAKETISFINTLGDGNEFYSTHPSGKHRLQNYEEARKYFMEDEWVKQGLYNIYNSDVLGVQVSSDRSSIVISRGRNKNAHNSYQAENSSDFYTRFAYKSYLNGEFKDAMKYFRKLFSINRGSYAAYLYASYTCEELYKKTGSEKYLNDAKTYAEYAKQLAPDNKFVKEQIESL